MKPYLIISAYCILLVGCKPRILPLSLQFEKIKKVTIPQNNKAWFLELTLISEQDIIKFSKKEGAINIYMFCPLSSNNLTSDTISLERYRINGSFPLDSSSFKDNKYVYHLPIDFESKDSGLMTNENIMSVLENRKCIDCKIVIAFPVVSFKSNRFSETFCIPVDSIKPFLKDSLIK
jgi:hypothetical protein